MLLNMYNEIKISYSETNFIVGYKLNEKST